MLRSESLSPQELSVRSYCERTQARSAQLLANSCRCAALLTGYGHGSAEAEAAEDYGCNLGMAVAISADLREFSEAVLEAEPATAQLVGAPSVVSLLAAERVPALLPVVSRQASSQADIAKVRAPSCAAPLVGPRSPRRATCARARPLARRGALLALSAFRVSTSSPPSPPPNPQNGSRKRGVRTWQLVAAVRETGAVAAARQLAEKHAALATAALERFAPSEARDALAGLCKSVLA